MDQYAEARDDEAAAPAKRRDDPGLARTRPLQPAPEYRSRQAKKNDTEREDDEQVGDAPVARRGEQRLDHCHVGACDRLVEADRLRQGNQNTLRP